MFKYRPVLARGRIADSPQRLVAGEVGDKQKSRFQWHNQCATLHVPINRLSIILVLPNTVVWFQFCYSLVRLGHGVRNLHTPWLGLITCDTLAHTGFHFADCEFVSSIKMRLAGANNCVVTKEHEWEWKPRGGPHHILCPQNITNWRHQYRKYVQ